MIKGSIRKISHLVTLLLIAVLASSCGGGGDDGGNGSGFVPAPEPEGADISVSITDRDGSAITEITPLREGLFRVKVLSPSGQPLSQEVVSAAASIGRVSPDSGTALTDEKGEAVFVVQADGVEGAGTFSASTTYDGVESSGSVNFAVSTQLPFSLVSKVYDSAGAMATTASTGDTLTLSVTLTDERFDAPIPNQVVSAEIGELGVVSPPSGNTVTNSIGEATFVIQVGEVPGAYPITVSVTVPGGGITDSITLSIDQAERLIGHIDTEGNFVEGVIKVTPEDSLSPGGTALLSIAIVDGDFQAIQSAEQVTLTSSCLIGDLATLEPPSPITMGASISVDYVLQGCEGEDLVTAKLLSSGAEASAVIDVAKPTAGKIVFVEAEPELIALRGSGSASDIAESSTVTFLVTDGANNPVPNVRVNFSLAQTVGGLALECTGSSYCLYATAEDRVLGRSSRDTALTSPAGEATTRVLSGTVASPVQVLAYADLNRNGAQDIDEPATTSKTLVVSTGIPDQNSISLSSTFLNVEGAYEIDGKSASLTVRMADSFNNPVPQGTAAVFSTELGSIVSSCTTVDGLCSVNWSSQSPRSSDTVDQYSLPITISENLDSSTPNRYRCPSHRENHGPCPDDIADPNVNPPGAPRGGRSTILVTATGEESFVDRNGNGRYDQGEFWTNLTEAFIDHNEDGIYTPAQRANCLDPATADDVCLAGFEEQFVDRNTNGAFDLNNTPPAAPGSSLPDGLFNGVLCSLADEAQGICSRELVDVRDSLVIVNAFENAANYDLLLINRYSRFEPTSLEENLFYDLYISDPFNNPPPPGTTIDFDGSGDCAPVTETPPVPDTNQAGAFSSSLVVATMDYSQSLEEAQGSDPDLITIKLTLPNGSFTTKTYACRVYRCADDPSQFPQFSPAPPSCGASGS